MTAQQGLRARKKQQIREQISHGATELFLARGFDKVTIAEVAAMMRRHCELLAEHMDGLIKEVLKDQANGLWGKTVIHPSHIPVVNALQAVSFEEWSDAEQVVATNTGGARKSTFSNKMNEGAPHRLWATKVQRRATAFGVLAEGHSFVSLLGG